jgi:preprotein translocase SecE subunit
VAEVKQDNRVVRYFKETRAELRKVHWPTRLEARNLTIIVLVFTVFMTFLLGVVLDPFALWLFKGVLINRSAVETIVGIVMSVVGLVALVAAMRRQ